jgi:cell shape-determining protein MreC
MEVLALIISIIALIVAILAYHKVGGVADLKKQTEVLTDVGNTIVEATESLRDKSADVLDRMEAFVRGTEEKEETPTTGKRKEARKASKTQMKREGEK